MYASVFPNAHTFAVRMVMRDHMGTFIVRKTRCFPSVDSVFEAETVVMREALSWIKGATAQQCARLGGVEFVAQCESHQGRQYESLGSGWGGWGL